MRRGTLLVVMATILSCTGGGDNVPEPPRAAIEHKGGLAAQVLSVPYVLVDLRGFQLEGATECELRIGGHPYPRTVM